MQKVQSLIKNKKGFSSSEIILALALIAFVFLSISSVLFYALEASSTVGTRVKGIYLANEAVEIMKNLRQEDFNNLANGTYGLQLNTTNNEWQLIPTSDTTDGYQRVITISTIDANTRRIVVQVNWTDSSGGLKSYQLVSYLKNIFRTIIVNPTWQFPTVDATVNFPGNTDGTAVDFNSNYVFVGTAALLNNLLVYDVTNTASPTSVGVVLNLGDIKDIDYQSNYIFVASGDNTSELKILNATNPTLITLTSSLNLGGNNDGQAVKSVGNYTVLGRANDNAQAEIFFINTTNKAAPTVVSSFEVGDSANDIYINGNYAYIATAANAGEISIINFTNPASPSRTLFDIPTNTNAEAVTGFGNRLFVGMANGSILLYNITNPTAPVLISTYTSSGSVNSLTTNGTGLIFAGYSGAPSSFQVVSYTTETTPFLWGTNATVANTTDIIYDSVKDRNYSVSDDNDKEFNIYKPNVN